MNNRDKLENSQINKIIDESIEMYLNHLQKYTRNVEEYQKLKDHLYNINRVIYKSTSAHAAITKLDNEYYLKINENLINEVVNNQNLHKEKLIRVLLHELTHATTRFYQGEEKLVRYEEGIADLLSDIIYKENYKSDKFKETDYLNSNTIIRTISSISNEKLIYSYITGNNKFSEDFHLTKFYQQLAKNIGGNNADKLLKYETENPTLQNLYKEEKDIIERICKQKINKKIGEIDPIYLHNNEIIQNIIYNQLVEEKTTDIKDIKEKYPNIPEEFYVNYSLKLSEMGTKVNYLNESFEVDPKKTKKYMSEIIEELSSKSYESIKECKIKEKRTEKIIEVLNQISSAKQILEVSNIELFSITSMLILSEIKASEIPENQIESHVNKIMRELLYKEDNNVTLIIKAETLNNYQIYKNKDDITEEIFTMYKRNIYNVITLNYYSKRLKEQKITLNEYKEVFDKLYRETTKNNNNYPHTLYVMYAETITEYNLNKKDFDIERQIDYFEKDLQNYNFKINPLYESKIVKVLLKKQPSIVNLFKALSKKDLRILDYLMYNEELNGIITDLEKLTKEELQKLLVLYNTENYQKNINVIANNKGISSNKNKLVNMIYDEVSNQIINNYISDNNDYKDIISSKEFIEFSVNEQSKESKKTLIDFELSKLSKKHPEITKKINSSDNLFTIGDSLIKINDRADNNSIEAYKETLKMYEKTPYLKNIFIKTITITMSQTIRYDPRTMKNTIERYMKYKEIPEFKTVLEESIQILKKSLLDNKIFEISNTLYNINSLLELDEIHNVLTEEEISIILNSAIDSSISTKQEVEELQKLIIKIDELILLYPNLDTNEIKNKQKIIIEIIDQEKNEEMKI